MEPVTHILTGACLSRVGFNRKAAYATAAMVVAAEFPDVDTLWSLRGPVSGFEHHRGFTHTFLGLPFEAALIVGIFVVFHRLRQRRALRGSFERSRNKAPVRWVALYGFVLLALLSHILLDYTNNYGVRPFFPFDGHWFAASIVFIFDPLIFVLLLAGLCFPLLFALIGQEIGAKEALFRGAGWARFALLLVVGLWCLRSYEHRRALQLADAQTLRAPSDAAERVPSDAADRVPTEATERVPIDATDRAPNDATDRVPTKAAGHAASGATDYLSSEATGQRGAPPSVAPDVRSQRDVSRPLLRPVRSLASPDPLSPFRWYTVTDYGPAYLLGTVNVRNASFEADRVLATLPKSREVLLAEGSHLGRVYLDWSPMPWITVSEDPSTQEHAHGAETSVLFQDPRFMGGSPWLHRGGLPPLTGIVHLTGDEITDQGIDGRLER